MLVITRKEREALTVGDTIRLVVLSIGPGKKALVSLTASPVEPCSPTRMTVAERSTVLNQEGALVVVSRIGPGRKIRFGIDAPGLSVRRE